MGAGSIGTIVGALISKAGLDIDLIDVDKEHIAALKENGAKVIGQMNLSTPVKVLTPDEMSGQYDLFLYLVKANHDHEALPIVKQHLKNNGVVLTMQNGIPEQVVAKYVGNRRTMGCAVGWGATLIRPGVSRMTSEVHRMTYDIGELDGSDSVRLQEVAEILSLAGKVYKTYNLFGLRWAKLMFNAPFNSISTIIGGTYGDVLYDDKALFCAAFIVREALLVARAADVHPQIIQEFDFSMLDFHTRKDLIKKLPMYGMFFGPHRDIKASMLYDIEKGESCEIEAINGVISEGGKSYKVATPVNDCVVKLIKEIESGQRKPGKANLDLIELPSIPEE